MLAEVLRAPTGQIVQVVPVGQSWLPRHTPVLFQQIAREVQVGVTARGR